jgi:hypothetical protein
MKRSSVSSEILYLGRCFLHSTTTTTTGLSNDHGRSLIVASVPRSRRGRNHNGFFAAPILFFAKR